LIKIDPKLDVEKVIRVQKEIIDWFTQAYLLQENDFLLRWGRNKLIYLQGNQSSSGSNEVPVHLARAQRFFLNERNISLAIGVGKVGEKYNLFNSYSEAKKALEVAKRTFSLVFYDTLLLDLI